MDDFVNFTRILYKDCKQYVPDLDSDIRGTFDPAKNPGLEVSDVQPFIAYKDGKVAGRIVGIINHNANEKWETKTVRFGFIEFIDDQQVSAALLQAVEQWGKEHGMTDIQGPLGITDFDKEGMLIEDFDKMGSMTAIYNYPYYPEHMKALGYEKAVDWVQVVVKIPEQVPERYQRVSDLSKKMFHLNLRKLTKKELKGGYIYRIFELLNKAYAPLYGFSQFTEKQADLFLKNYLPVLNMDFCPMIEDEDGNLISLAVTIGSVAKALQKSKGKMLPLGWFHLLKALKWKPEKSAELLLVAVDPEYQGLGVNALIFADLIPVYNKYGIKVAETGPQLENNIKELSQWKYMNPETVKRRRCWKKNI